jgi:hypothetical protein
LLIKESSFKTLQTSSWMLKVIKYVNLVNDVVKPLQESVIKQAELIKQQSATIDKHVVKLTQHEHTVNKQDEIFCNKYIIFVVF